MAIEHKNIAEGQLHEPKGVSVASSGQAYVADGAGSGSFQNVVTPEGATEGYAFISDGAGGGSFKKITRMGYHNYEDTATAITPIVLSPVSTFVKLTNDELGPVTQKIFALPEVTDTWNSITNQFDFSDLSIGDVISLRFDLQVTTTGANHEIKIKLDLGIGGIPFTIPLEDAEFRTTGTHDIVRTINLFIGDANVQNFPAEILASSDSATDSVIIRGWLIETVSRGDY